MPLIGAGRFLSSLILYRTGFIPSLDPFVGLNEILAVTGFIAQ
jgi:hypothetical protein